MRTFVAWLVATSFVVEGALYCPLNYCLMQIGTAKGPDDVAAFSCEQYPVAEHTCDFEDGPANCTCNGEVRYGNYARMSGKDLKPEIWTAPKNVMGNIKCSNGVFSHVVSGAKICTCTPTMGYTPVRDTKPPITYLGVGYAEPTCVIQKLGLDTVFPLNQLWGYGLNQGQISLSYTNLFGMAQGMAGFSSGVTMRDFDYQTYVSTVQFDGLKSSAYNATLQFNAWRSDNAPLKEALNNFFDAAGSALGDAQTMGLLKAASLGPLVLPRAWDKPVWCPQNYCLNPVRPGTSSASFTCERFPGITHICAGEGLGMCACDGVARYGNWARYDLGVKTQASWVEANVTGSVDCSSNFFTGGPARTKYCTCTPTASTSYSRSSMPALDDQPGFTADPNLKYQAPTCLTMAIEMTSGLDKTSMETAGVNKGLVDYFASVTIKQMAGAGIDIGYATSGFSIIQEWENTSTTILAQLQGGASFNPATAAATMQTESFGTTMSAVVKQVAAAGGDDTKQLAAAGPGYSIGYGPLPKVALPFTVAFPATATPTTSTSAAPTSMATDTTVPMEEAEPEPQSEAATSGSGSSTSAPSGGTTGGDGATTVTVAGAFTVTVSDPNVILGNPAAKAKFEEAMKKSIATESNVAEDKVTVTASAGARRLTSAEPRELAGTIKIDYTITTTKSAQASVMSLVTAFTSDTAKMKQVTQTAIQGIDSTTCANCATTTVTAAENTTPPVATANEETSSANRSHVLWALFSFAATWLS